MKSHARLFLPEYKQAVPLLLSLLVFFLAGCGQPGYYSVVVMNKQADYKANGDNDLRGTYHSKQLSFPAAITYQGDSIRKNWDEELKGLNVRTIETTLDATSGCAVVNLPDCNKKGIAIIVHDGSYMKKRGKQIFVKLRYVCMEDYSAEAWAATEFYRILPPYECESGFHSLELQFIAPKINKKGKNAAPLMRVITVCAKS